MREGFYYLASPYSHPDAAVRAARADALKPYLHGLARDGYICYAPILHWHPVAVAHDMPTGADWWWHNNLQFMRASRGIIVAMIDGWRESKGLQKELDWADINCDSPTSYVRLTSDGSIRFVIR